MLRLASRLIIQNPETLEVLVVNRRGKLNCLCFPGGKVDEGETFEEGVVREVLEETGLQISPEALTLVYEGVVGNDAPGDSNLYQVQTFVTPYSDAFQSSKIMEDGIIPRWVSPEVFLAQCMAPEYDHLVWESFEKIKVPSPNRSPMFG